MNSIAKDTSESEIVRLELLELARNAISQYATKFKGDGVTKSEISDMYYLIRDTLEDIETTTEKQLPRRMEPSHCFLIQKRQLMQHIAQAREGLSNVG